MQPKRATIYEVASLAGVSHQTVSRYLRHNGGLRPATTAKVEKAIAELNYRPNLVARSMRTRRTGRLAEARISYGGRGTISDVQTPRYGQELLDIILPF